MNDYITLWCVWVFVLWAVVVIRPKADKPANRHFWR